MRARPPADPVQATETIRGAKSPEAFRTISEASSELGVPQHVLRFWETKFSFIRPMKRAGGRRFYRRQDIAVLKGVRALLHESGYTIKGVQRLHKVHGTRVLVGAGEGDIPPPVVPMLEVQAENRIAANQEDIPEELFGVLRAGLISRPALTVGDRAILRTDARTRLDAVLRDIEQAKAAIDHLLAERDD